MHSLAVERPSLYIYNLRKDNDRKLATGPTSIDIFLLESLRNLTQAKEWLTIPAKHWAPPCFQVEMQVALDQTPPSITELDRISEQNPGSYHNPPSGISETNCPRLENGLTQVHTVSQFPRLLLVLILFRISSPFYIFVICRENQTNKPTCYSVTQITYSHTQCRELQSLMLNLYWPN